MHEAVVQYRTMFASANPTPTHAYVAEKTEN